MLAAIKAGAKTVVLPQKNRDDYEEIDKEIRSKIQCSYIQKGGKKHDQYKKYTLPG
ncbi:endopeptidase La [Candidatus Brocadia pituitae]|nr:endopeptidase La [Candidatus Brocadia pituitae]